MKTNQTDKAAALTSVIQAANALGTLAENPMLPRPQSDLARELWEKAQTSKLISEYAALNAVAEAARLIEGCSEIRPNETPGGYKRRILEPVMDALKNLQSIRNQS